MEQEIENLKKKLAACTRENINLQEQLSEAYRIKVRSSFHFIYLLILLLLLLLIIYIYIYIFSFYVCNLLNPHYILISLLCFPQSQLADLHSIEVSNVSPPPPAPSPPFKGLCYLLTFEASIKIHIYPKLPGTIANFLNIIFNLKFLYFYLNNYLFYCPFFF